MEKSHRPHTDFYEVLVWAMENRKLWVFKYIVELNGKSWYEEIINIKSCIHDLIWTCVLGNRVGYARFLLKIPGLFDKEELIMDKHHNHTQVPKSDRFRTDNKIYFTTGLYYDKALEFHSPTIAAELKKYFEKETKKLR